MYDIYQCNKDDTARFALGKSGRRILYVIGLNPSTANKDRSDVTVAKVERVSINNKYDGFIMLNLYPLRATNPKSLPKIQDDIIYRENISKIVNFASKQESPIFWAAWGGGIKSRPYFPKALIALVPQIKSLGGHWVSYGDLRVDGHPRHPSRLSYSWAFSKFDMALYIRSLA